MAKRTSVRKFKTEKVQGAGSFVKLSSLKVSEVREMRLASKDDDFDAFEGGIGLLARHIVDWNWVDDDGEPLPLPSENPKVIDELTHTEADFLSELLVDADTKN